MGYADAGALSFGAVEQRGVAGVPQYIPAWPFRRLGDNGSRQYRRIHLDAYPMGRQAGDRYAGVAAVDDARDGPRRRVSLGVCLSAFGLPDLRNDLGPADSLRCARNADCGTGDVGSLSAVILRSRRVLPGSRRDVVANALADPDRACVAVLRRWMGADVLRHHA